MREQRELDLNEWNKLMRVTFEKRVCGIVEARSVGYCEC